MPIIEKNEKSGVIRTLSTFFSIFMNTDMIYFNFSLALTSESFCPLLFTQNISNVWLYNISAQTISKVFYHFFVSELVIFF